MQNYLFVNVHGQHGHVRTFTVHRATAEDGPSRWPVRGGNSDCIRSSDYLLDFQPFALCLSHLVWYHNTPLHALCTIQLFRSRM